ncbi:unnamed protein product, partial [Durusdinium trenchii]
STSHSQFRPTFFVLHVPRVVSAFGQAMGSINPVAGGLVLIHGTPTQRRQLHRGELRGLLEDAQEDFPPRRRWPLWFNAFVKAHMEPVLVLRLAELASLDDELRSEETWSGWLTRSW